jgi:hypothetical protein
LKRPPAHHCGERHQKGKEKPATALALTEDFGQRKRPPWRFRCDTTLLFGSGPTVLPHRLNPFLRFLESTPDIQHKKRRQGTDDEH